MQIIDALNNLINSNPVNFTTPGHSQGSIIPENVKNLLGEKLFKTDFSEIIGLDNLQAPEGVILKSQKWLSEVYNSSASFYLVNGSSSGILALMLATVKEGEKVLIARNAHKSVINALVLTGACPVWINTEWEDNWDIPTQVSFEKIKNTVELNPDIKAIWLTNPTYEGIVTDITPIAEFCKEKNIILIVDEAHGALWNFSLNLPEPAILKGADASVQSLHKTSCSLNQGAILHLSKNSKINPEKLQQCLNMVNTTSPFFPLLASIEGAIEYQDSESGRKKLEDLLDNLDEFREKLSKFEEINSLKANCNYGIDKTRLFFGIKGICGHALADYLYDNYRLEVELDNDRAILAITGIGTDKEKLDKLFKGILEANKALVKKEVDLASSRLIEPEIIYTPRQAFYKNSSTVSIEEAIGHVSKETIVPYPPGIPVLIAGELIKKEHVNFIKNKLKINIISD